MTPKGTQPEQLEALAGRLSLFHERPQAHQASILEEAVEALLDAATALSKCREALRQIADSKPRPQLDPMNCEERLRRIARNAIAALPPMLRKSEASERSGTHEAEWNRLNKGSDA